MQFYMLPWRSVTGPTGPVFEPHATFGAAVWTCIDLRPDPTVAVGWCFVGSDIALSGLPGSALDLGTNPLTLTGRQRNTIAGNLGVTLGASSLRDALLELLTDRAAQGGWRPLQPRAHGPNQWEIWLGGQLLHAVPRVQGGAVYTESFNKADSTVLGPDLTWTETTGGGKMVVAVNRCTVDAGNNQRARARAEHDATGGAQFAQATVAHLTSHSYCDLGVCLRWDAAAADTQYGLVLLWNSGYKHGIRKWVGGAETKLTSEGAYSHADGLVLRGEHDGSTVSMSYGGTALASVTDTSVTGGRGGITFYRNSSDSTTWPIVDDFSFGDLGGAATTPVTTTRSTSWDVAAAPVQVTSFRATTWSVDPAPTVTAPTGLTATPNGPTRIDISHDAVTGAAAYGLDHSVDGITWEPLVAAQEATTYSHTGLEPGSTHHYRARTFGAAATDLRDPNLPRVAYTCDGNKHDEDDWGASAVSLSLLQKEYRHNIVHWEYNNHFFSSDGGTHEGLTWKQHSYASNVTCASNFGFDTSRWHDCTADGDGTYAAAAKASFVAAINASTSTDRLLVFCAGPMETIWQALNEADATARQYVDLVSHSTWNEVHASETTSSTGHPDAPHGGHSWADLDAFGCTTIDISDQNGTGKLGDQELSNFYFYRDSADPDMQYVYERIEAVTLNTTTDVSDAGMVLWLLNGRVEPSTSPTYPERIKTYLGL